MPNAFRSHAVPRAAGATIIIDNFGEVATTSSAAQPDDGDYAALAAFGIKTVIDLPAVGLFDDLTAA